MLTPPYTPEMLESVQEFIKQDVGRTTYGRESLVLEYGSGWSTVWFASMGHNVLSFEHDFAWWLLTTRTLRSLGLKGTVLLTEPSEFALTTQYLPYNTFDLIYVDCYDSVRTTCGLTAMTRLKVGGLLVVDDTHWEVLRQLLSGIEESRKFERVERFKGDHLRKDGSTHYHQTDVYRRIK